MQSVGAARPNGLGSAEVLPRRQCRLGQHVGHLCSLARDGGPPHRGTLLEASPTISLDSRAFQSVAAEIIRGVEAVSGLPAFVSAPGWIGVRCTSEAMARWLSESIVLENVEARSADKVLLLPAGDDYTVAHEIKNVITAVAKTTHYWKEHAQRERSVAQRAHPETVVLDIGGDVGALIIYAGQHLRGRQIDVTAEASAGPPIHTDILERRRNGRAVYASGISCSAGRLLSDLGSGSVARGRGYGPGRRGCRG